LVEKSVSKIFQNIIHIDKVALFLNKTSNQRFGKHNLKPFYFLLILFGVLMSGCALMPMQKAGSEALAEAICLYDKKIDKKTAEYNKCLTGQVR
jgi:hypothetical protein